jgi:membrane-associated progesterone receptor component
MDRDSENFDERVDYDALPDDLKKTYDTAMNDMEMGGTISWDALLADFMEWCRAVVNVFLERLRQGQTAEVVVVALTLLLGALLAYGMITSRLSQASSEEKDEEEVIPQRDFTLEQLRTFDGREEKKIDGSMGEKPIYIAIKREVYDVSEAPESYGKDGSYHMFAGKDASRALGKFTFDEDVVNNLEYEDLTNFERDCLENFVVKFKYHKGYPVRGILSFPPKDLKLTRSDLLKFRGEENQEVPKGRMNAPIYMAVNGNILDVSYGGYASYKPGGPYHVFAGHDATVALGKMSLKTEDVENSGGFASLTEAEQKILLDWEDRFLNKNLYPIVGKLIEE